MYVDLLIGAAFADATVGLIKAIPHIVSEVLSEFDPSAVGTAVGTIVGTVVKLLDNEGEPGGLNDLEKVKKSEERLDASQSIVVQLRILTGMLPKMQSFFNDEGTLNAQKIETIVPFLKTTFEGMFADHSTSWKIKSVTTYFTLLPNVSNTFSGSEKVPFP